MKNATNWKPPKMFQESDAVGGLLLDDDAQVERLRAQHHADQREAQRQFVADQLRGGAQRAEQRVLVVRRPAGERDAVDADGGDAENDQQADVDIGDLEEVHAIDPGDRSEGHHGDGDQRAAQGEDGREQKSGR